MMTSNKTFRCPHCGQQHPWGTEYCPLNGLPIEAGSAAPTRLARSEGPLLSRSWLIGGGVAALVILALAAVVTLTVLGRRNRPAITPTVFVILPATTETAAAPATPSGEHVITPTPGVTAVEVTPWPACPDAVYLSRLQVGDTVAVSSNPPLANRVRSDASLDATVLGFIQPGEEALILDGPRCANAWVWWKVRANTSGLEGWTAEGDEENYWLVPLAP